jgi:hypothetical protein
VAADIVRLHEGKLVEHWDVIQVEAIAGEDANAGSQRSIDVDREFNRAIQRSRVTSR